MNSKNKDISLENLDNSMDDILKLLEYMIENISDFEQLTIQNHTTPVNTKFYIEYKYSQKLSLSNLIDNTIERYYKDIENSKYQYERNLSFNQQYSNAKFKNYIPVSKINHIKSKLENNSWKLCQVDKAVMFEKPILSYFHVILHTLNNIFYIVNVQFKNSATKYKRYTYEAVLDNRISEEQTRFNQYGESEAKLHKGILDIQKESYIESSLITSILNQSDKFTEILKDELSSKDLQLIQNNQHFKKRIDKINFTENDLYNGFSQMLYWHYAHSNYDGYKKARLEINKQIKKSKSSQVNELIIKKTIANNLYELINYIFGEDTITPIRERKEKPKILTKYDDILIPTIKNIDKIEQDFFDFYKNTIFSESDIIKKYMEEKNNGLSQIIKNLRPLFF